MRDGRITGPQPGDERPGDGTGTGAGTSTIPGDGHPDGSRPATIDAH
jgi:hypothetical protein